MRFLAVSAIAFLMGACAFMTDDSNLNAGLMAFSQGEYESAVEKFTPLDEQNDPQAQFAIGIMYRNGSGVAQDDAEAVRWLLKSAEQRNPYALSVLGAIYKEGRGVQQDNLKAYMWFDLAVAQFDYKPGRHYAKQDRDAVAKNMTGDQLAEAKQMALEWLLANGGVTPAVSDAKL